MIFAFCAINLLISLIRTITTSPGYIPEHGNWDMLDPREAQRQRLSANNSSYNMSAQERMPNLEGGDIEHTDGQQLPVGGSHSGPRFTAQSNMSEMLRHHNQNA